MSLSTSGFPLKIPALLGATSAAISALGNARRKADRAGVARSVSPMGEIRATRMRLGIAGMRRDIQERPGGLVMVSLLMSFVHISSRYLLPVCAGDANP